MAVLTQEDRILIEALRNQKGFGAKRIIKEYPAKRWQLGTVKKFLQRLTATGSRTQKVGSGLPGTAWTMENVHAVEELVLSQEDKPGASLRF